MKRSRVFLLSFVAGLLGLHASIAEAVLVYETDYTLRNDNGNPFVDGGELRFQDGWLGQTGYTVDSDAPGTVSASGGFLRVLNNNGATGGTAGGGSDELGAGFNDGDSIRIVTTLQYELLSAPNQALSTIGVRPNFATGGFNASPTSGFKTAYNSFDGGSIKVFTGLGRQGFNGGDNAFALFITGDEGGFNSGDTGQPMDLSTDTFEFDYTAEFLSDAWVATELIVRNLDDGGAIVAQATVDNLGALESTAYTGSEAYYGQRFTDAGGVVVTSDRMRFEYAAVPEPGTTVLLGCVFAGLLAKRRR